MGRPKAGGKGIPVRLPVELAEHARFVGLDTHKTAGEVISEIVGRELEARYREAMRKRSGQASEMLPAEPQVTAYEGPTELLPAAPQVTSYEGPEDPEASLRKKARELYQQGKTQREVAAELGIALGKVNKLLRDPS